MIAGSFKEVGSDIEEVVRKRINDVFLNILKIRNDDPQEKLVLLVDSLADLRVFTIISEESTKANLKTELLYFVTNFYDSPSENSVHLEKMKTLGVAVTQLDTLRPDRDILKAATQIFAEAKGSVGISNLSDDYDIRQATNDFASQSRIPILEVPSIDMIALTSEVFSEDLEKMRQLGNTVNSELEKYEHLVFISSDGTYLKMSVNPAWLNEGMNNFSNRYWDSQDLNAATAFPQDNPPGEIYTNIRNANGRLVLYQFDNDVARYALRNRRYLPFEMDIDDPILITCNMDEPVALQLIDGTVDLSSIDTTQSTRAKILKYYFEQKHKEDEYFVTEYEKHPHAASRAAELGFGINAKANNPEEEVLPGVRIDSTLITEKKLGIWHIAFGNTPCPDIEKYFNHSSSHIDCGMRNPDLYVFGLKDGKKTLIFSTEPEMPGAIDQIIKRF